MLVAQTGLRNIETVDMIIIIGYLVGIVALGCFAGVWQRRKSGIKGGKDYFLAGGTLTWPMIGLALFSTNISTTHLVGQAQEGFKNGLAHGNFEWMAAFTLIALALFFAPFYFRSKVATLPDFLERRYSRGARNWLAILSIVSAVFIHIGFTLYTGAVVLHGMFGIPLMYSIVGVAILTGLYTIVGGLLAVVLTESIQTIVLLIGAVSITFIGMHSVGGWEGLSESVEPVKLTVLRAKSDPANLPWYSVFLGYPIIGLWYWCADQTIVQRVLGAKDENHARVGPLFAGFIKILPMFIFFLPGLAALGLIHQGKMEPLPVQKPKEMVVVQNATPAQRKVVDAVNAWNGAAADGEKSLSAEAIVKQTGLDQETAWTAITDLTQADALSFQDDIVYAHMITRLLPVGLRGLIAAALLAALMSTVSGALNSIATLFSYDIWKQLRPETSDKTLIRIGRIATFVAMVFAILWSPLVAHFESIYQGSNKLICYIAPPITVVFLLGVFWRKASAQGALATLFGGSCLGATVFGLDWWGYFDEWQQHTALPLSFMMRGFYLFCLCMVIMISVSLVKPAPASAEVDKLVWKHPLECFQGKAWSGIGNYKFLSILLFVIMVGLYIKFA